MKFFTNNENIYLLLIVIGLAIISGWFFVDAEDKTAINYLVRVKSNTQQKIDNNQVIPYYSNSFDWLIEKPINTISYFGIAFSPSYYLNISKKENQSYLAKDEPIKEEPLKLLFFGDMMLDRSVGDKIKANGLDYVFSKLKEDNFFDDYDLIGSNLEGTVTNNGAHYSPILAYDFAFDPQVVEGLKEYNFNFFNLANNHFSDQGEQGISETRINLDKLGFSYVGCRNGRISDCSGKIIEIGGKKIGMLGFSTVYAKFDQDKANQIIQQLEDSTDLIIANIHWGIEYSHNQNQTQQKIAHNLIDAGVDIIIGHHPHVVQGIEIYKNKPIFYSLGNFVFDQYFSAATQEGLAIGVEINNQNMILNLYPLKSKLSQVELISQEEKRDIFLEKLNGWSSVDEQTSKQIKNGVIDLK